MRPESEARPPAHDLQAERAFLGALLSSRDPKVIEGLLALVPSDEFYDPKSAEIFRAVEGQLADELPVDGLSITHRLSSTGGRADAILVSTCLELAPLGDSVAPYYAGIIRDHARTRRMQEQAARLAQIVNIDEPDRRDLVLREVLGSMSAELDITPHTIRGQEQLLDFARLLSTDYNNIQSLTALHVGPGEQIALVGSGKAGKSLFAMEWAIRASIGLPFLGHQHTGPLRVAYIDQENPHPEIQRRLRTTGFIDPLLLVNLSYASFPPFRPLDTPEGAADLLRFVDRFEPDLLYLDTISRMIEGEENSNDTWLSVYRLSMLPLKARGVTSIRLDHYGKDETRGARGASAKTQDVDHVWEMQAAPGGMIRLRRTFSRSGVGEGVIMVKRHGSSQEMGTTTHEAINWGGAEQDEWIARGRLAKLADDSGLPADAGRTALGKLFRTHGHKVGNDIIKSVQEFRMGLQEGGQMIGQQQLAEFGEILEAEAATAEADGSDI